MRGLIVSLVASFFAVVRNRSYIVASFLQSLEVAAKLHGTVGVFHTHDASETVCSLSFSGFSYEPPPPLLWLSLTL